MTSLRGVVVLGAAETFGRALTWLTIFVLPWALGEAEYGSVVLLATFESVAVGVLLLGQDSAIFWRCGYRDDPDRAGACVAGAATITASACLLALLAVTIAASVSHGTLLGVPLWPHVWLLTVGVTLSNLNRIGLAFARARGHSVAFVLDRLAVGAGRFGITLAVAFSTGWALSFPIGMTVGIAAGGAWLFGRLILGKGRLRAARSEIRPLLAFGTPLSAHLLAMTTIAMVDRWVIGAVLGLAAVGSYGWYYMLGSGVVFVSAALSVSYEPLIYREYQENASTRSLREYLGITIAASAAYGLVGCGLAAVAGGVVPDSVRADPAIAAVVLLAHWFRPVYLAAGYLLSAVGRTGRVAAISGVAVVVTVAANLLLVPPLGLMGGAWATLIGLLVLVAASIVALRHLSMPVRVLMAPTAAIAVVGAATLFRLTLVTFAAASAVLLVYGVVASGILHRLGRPPTVASAQD
ncbi:MAG TPA: lipopolysaccharide biosynthesis protein [Longimicrobiales bacterium]|nr:lipopolysaccharide biosynthesis protein [Longimicrobiales bacterium]